MDAARTRTRLNRARMGCEGMAKSKIRGVNAACVRVTKRWVTNLGFAHQPPDGRRPSSHSDRHHVPLCTRRDRGERGRIEREWLAAGPPDADAARVGGEHTRPHARASCELRAEPDPINRRTNCELSWDWRFRLRRERRTCCTCLSRTRPSRTSRSGRRSGTNSTTRRPGCTSSRPGSPNSSSCQRVRRPIRTWPITAQG